MIKSTHKNAVATPSSDATPCSADFKLGGKVIYQGEERTIYDIDKGYDILALDGDKYIAPNHTCNRCIEAPMSECVLLPNVKTANKQTTRTRLRSY